MTRKFLKISASIIRDNSKEFDRIVRDVTKSRADAVYIGILQEEQPTGGKINLAGIATVHEFGAAIKGTAFGDIIIPERSFIRSTMDEKREQIAQLSDRLWQLVIRGKITKFVALSRMGIFIQGAIRRKIATLDSPPNAPATVAIKGFDNPLIGPAPALMQKAINFVVRKK